jgi:integrase
MAEKITATLVKNWKKPGYLSDQLQTGLYLKTSKAGSKSWIFRWRDRATGKLRDMGLGGIDVVSLSEAREAAREARKLVHAGQDPIEQKKLARQTLKDNAVTFAECAERYISAKEHEWTNAKHAQQWRNTLNTHASDINCKYVGAINFNDVLHVLEPIWKEKPETANRVRGRIEKVLDWATVRNYRKGDNPARWKGNLDAILPSTQKLKGEKHHASLPYKQIGTFMADLRKREGAAARCLEFLILTGARTNEAIGAEWSEIDWEERVWTVPATRMKAGREHKVPLSDAALKVLKAQQGHHAKYVFPGDGGKKGLSNMAMLVLLKQRMGHKNLTVHGFRSTFRSWAGETTNFPRLICEVSLAHVAKDKVEAAYWTPDLRQQRFALLEAWASYIDAPKSKTVTPIKKVG